MSQRKYLRKQIVSVDKMKVSTDENKSFHARRSPFSVHDAKVFSLSPKNENLLREIDYKSFKERRVVFDDLKPRVQNYCIKLN